MSLIRSVPTDLGAPKEPEILSYTGSSSGIEIALTPADLTTAIVGRLAR
jgi:hypothetical protein